MAVDYEKKEKDYFDRVNEMKKGKKISIDGFRSLMDAGREEIDYRDSEVAKESPKKKKVTHERVRIDRKNFPYLQEKKIGEVCVVLCEIRKVGENVPDEYETDRDESITIEIMGIAEPEEQI